MLRTRLTLVATVISSLFIVSLLPANSASIAGTKCTKLNSTKTVSNIKYTCIKSGKKLVWNKGISLLPAPAKPSPSAIPSQSATPAPSSTPSVSKSPESTPVKPEAIVKAGDICKTQGEIASSQGIKLVCRQIANRQNIFFELTSTFTTESNPKSPDGLATCRLTDQRPTPIQPEGTKITYPIEPHQFSVKSGIEKIAVVGFDFSDSPGQGSPLDIYGSDLAKTKEFFEWYSNGKVKLEITTYDKWIRLSQLSNKYETGEHFSSTAGSLTVEQMAHEFYDTVNKFINLNGYTSIWFVYPKTIEKITQNFGLAAGNYGLISIYGLGPVNYQSALPIWTYFIHEMLHEQGLQGHSPKAPWRFGVLLNGDGYTAGLNSWDELSVDWMTEDEIYCVNKSNLKPVQIKLAPIERKQGGVHSIMIKLDNHRALVIESHRSGEFAQGMPDYGYGVTVQLVDTTKITTWNDDKATSEYIQFYPDNRFGPEYGTRIDTKRANDSGVNLFNGVGVSGARWGLDQNYLLLQGESYTFEGIKIEFLSSGNTDLISIS